MWGPIIPNFVTHDTVFIYSSGYGTVLIGLIIDGETPENGLCRGWLGHSCTLGDESYVLTSRFSVGIEPPSQKAGYPQDRCADDSATYPQVLDIPYTSYSTVRL